MYGNISYEEASLCLLNSEGQYKCLRDSWQTLDTANTGITGSSDIVAMWIEPVRQEWDHTAHYLSFYKEYATGSQALSQ